MTSQSPIAAAPAAAPAPDGVPMSRRILSVIAICIGVSIAILDASIANVGLPTIAQSLHIDESDSIWVVNAYQLVIMLCLLTGSALGEIVGYKRVYLTGIAIFFLASIGCTFSQSFAQLIFWRALQGLGASGTMSVNTTLIRFTYPKRLLGRGLGINATMVAISFVAGPTLAAAILAVGPWNWLFAINIPICLVAFVLGYFYLPDNPCKDVAHTFRWRDSVLNALTFGLFIFAIEGFSHGLSLQLIGAMLVALLIVGSYYIRTQLRERYPLLPFDLLRKPIFTLSVVTSICSFIAQMLGMVGLPFFIQQQLGYDAVTTGLIMTSWPAVIIVAAPVSGYLVERVHAGLLGGIGLLLMTLGFTALLFVPTDVSIPNLVWRMMLCGAGFGLFQSPNNSILLASAPPQRSGSASGMLATARLIGQTVGAAFVALLFHLFDASGPRYAFLLAAGFALFATTTSFYRIKLPLPEGLYRKMKKE